jgi:predicted metal-dependent hydrolase
MLPVSPKGRSPASTSICNFGIGQEALHSREHGRNVPRASSGRLSDEAEEGAGKSGREIDFVR